MKKDQPQKDASLPSNEKIIRAAIKVGQIVHIGRAHNIIYGDLAKFRIFDTGNFICGFVSSTYKFYNRRDAARIAMVSGQIRELKNHHNELYSDDLW